MRLAWFVRILLVSVLAVVFASAPAFGAPAEAAVGDATFAAADVPWWVLAGIAAGSLVLVAGIGRDRRAGDRRSSTSTAVRRTPQRLTRYASPQALEPSRSMQPPGMPLPARPRPLHGATAVRRRSPVSLLVVPSPAGSPKSTHRTV